MPIIYLSPSTQENNLYVNGGTEEEWMNRLADAMEPYLTASGIRYSRNTPDMTAAWPSTPMPPRRGSTARPVEFWCSTIPALSRGSGRPHWWRTG